MCRAAADDGVEVLAATPHVRHDYPTTAEQMEAAFAEVQAAAAGIVRLVPGAELDLLELDHPREELARFALDLAHRIARLAEWGVAPVLAHPERNDEVQRRPELLEPVVDRE